MNFGNKFHRNPNILGNKLQSYHQMGNKLNRSTAMSQNLKKPDISDGIINNSNTQDIHREPMGLNNMKKQQSSNLEKVRTSKGSRFV